MELIKWAKNNCVNCDKLDKGQIKRSEQSASFFHSPREIVPCPILATVTESKRRS